MEAYVSFITGKKVLGVFMRFFLHSNDCMCNGIPFTDVNTLLYYYINLSYLVGIVIILY